MHLDIDQLKAQAKRLGAYLLESHKKKLGHSHCLHAIAAMHGFPNYNTALESLKQTGPATLSLQERVQQALAEFARGRSPVIERDPIDPTEWCFYDDNPQAPWEQLDLPASTKGDFHTHTTALLTTLAKHPHHLDAMLALGEAHWDHGAKKEASAIWHACYQYVRPALDSLLSRTETPYIEYGASANRPLFCALHSYAITAPIFDATGGLETAIELTRIGYLIGRKRDNLGFRILHLDYLAQARRWINMLGFANRNWRGLETDFDFHALASAAACMTGRTPDKWIHRMINANPFAAEVVAANLTPQGIDTSYIMASTWQHGVYHLRTHGHAWADPRARAILKNFEQAILAAQQANIARHRELFRSAGRGPALADYLARHATPRVGSYIPLLHRK